MKWLDVFIYNCLQKLSSQLSTFYACHISIPRANCFCILGKLLNDDSNIQIQKVKYQFLEISYRAFSYYEFHKIML